MSPLVQTLVALDRAREGCPLFLCLALELLRLGFSSVLLHRSGEHVFGVKELTFRSQLHFFSAVIDFFS